MRLAGRGALAGVAALVAGYVVSLIGAVWLRSSTPDAALVWRAAQPKDVAGWTFAGAHGVPLRLEPKVGLNGGIGERLGNLFGKEISGVAGGVTIRLAPLLVLLVAGLVLAFVMRASRADNIRDVAAGAAVAGAVYGVGLALIAFSARATVGFSGRVLNAGLDVRTNPGATLAAGAIVGALFAFLGGLCVPVVAERISPLWRGVGAGLRRGAWVAAAAAIVGLIVLAATHSGGSGPFARNGKLDALAVVLLGPNIVSAAVVLAHGATLHASFDAGPLANVSTIGYGTAGAGPARWLMLLVPVLAGFFAGRAMRKRIGDTPMVTAAISVGAVWGFLLLVVSVLLYVQLLTNFAIGALGVTGSVEINGLVAFLFGFVWVVPASFAGMATVRAVSPDAPVRTATQPQPAHCENCGARVISDDSFCTNCGTRL